jgi:hypothetical protein
VHEDVIAILPLDESIALGRVKPFHCAFFFHVLPFSAVLLLAPLPDPKKNGGRGFDTRATPNLDLAEQR